MNKTVAVPAEPLTDNQLTNRTYLVTGATGGLGYKTALQLAKHGATVILTGRNEEKLDQLYDEIEQAGYPQAAIIPFDLEQTDEDIYKQLANSIYNEFKKLDGIVHCACHLGIIGPMGSQDGAFWLKTQQVNVNAAAILSKVCLPLLQQAKHASITFVSDSSARNSKAYWGAYGVSKVAVESISSMLADELDSSPIVSNVFTPGPCCLPIRKKTHPGEDELGLPSAVELAQALIKIAVNKQSGLNFSFKQLSVN